MIVLFKHRQRNPTPQTFFENPSNNFVGGGGVENLANPLYDDVGGIAVVGNSAYGTVDGNAVINPIFAGVDVEDEPNFEFGYFDVSV